MNKYESYEIFGDELILHFKLKGQDCQLSVPTDFLFFWIEEEQKTTRERVTAVTGITPDYQEYEISPNKYIEWYFDKSEQEEFFNSLLV